MTTKERFLTMSVYVTRANGVTDQPMTAGRIVRRDRLGGLIHEYAHIAA